MKAEYLDLDNGRSIRIYWNMNALAAFTKLTGKELTDLDGKADIGTLRTIAWCSAIEGELADGKELGLTEMEFGRLMNMASMVIFSRILVKQSNNDWQKKSPAKGRLPRIFFRKGA